MQVWQDCTSVCGPKRGLSEEKAQLQPYCLHLSSSFPSRLRDLSILGEVRARGSSWLDQTYDTPTHESSTSSINFHYAPEDRAPDVQGSLMIVIRHTASLPSLWPWSQTVKITHNRTHSQHVHSVCPKWHHIPYIVHYYGPWSKVVHYTLKGTGIVTWPPRFSEKHMKNRQRQTRVPLSRRSLWCHVRTPNPHLPPPYIHHETSASDEQLITSSSECSPPASLSHQKDSYLITTALITVPINGTETEQE